MNLLLSITNETRTFAQIMQDEWIGLIASAFILVSFFFSKQFVTRIINLCGCIVFVIYGLLLPSYSTMLMNIALVIVHIVFIVKEFLAKKRARLEAQQKDQPSTKVEQSAETPQETENNK